MRSALARLRRRKDEEIVFDTWNYSSKTDGTAPQVNGIRYFSFEELNKYTNNFSQSNLIWGDRDGKVYKGYLPNGEFVTIKHWAASSSRDVQEFKNEIELLSRIHHKNIVSLVGFCFEQGERLLVYEYISNGSLKKILYDQNSILEWKQRLGIALDLARGLAYLHELVNPQIIHGDPNPTNVLLDENLNAKLTYFGLSKLSLDKEGVELGFIAGTPGYVDKECMYTGMLSEKSDVYTFGVVMLELLTGRLWCERVNELGQRRPIMEDFKMAIDPYDREYYGLKDLIDPRIMNHARNIGLRNFLQLAWACISESASERPSMLEVMEKIDITVQNF